MAILSHTAVYERTRKRPRCQHFPLACCSLSIRWIQLYRRLTNKAETQYPNNRSLQVCMYISLLHILYHQPLPRIECRRRTIREKCTYACLHVRRHRYFFGCSSSWRWRARGGVLRPAEFLKRLIRQQAACVCPNLDRQTALFPFSYVLNKRKSTRYSVVSCAEQWFLPDQHQ